MGGSGDFWKEDERKKDSWTEGTDPHKDLRAKDAAKEAEKEKKKKKE